MTSWTAAGGRAGRAERRAGLRGEAGIGKTALLGYAIESASDLRIMRAVGVESEMELAFAGLRQLCLPMLGRLDGLPDPQRDALQTAFGLSPAGRAGSVPGGIGGAEPVVGRGGGAAAPPLLLRAAKRLEPLDVGLARATYLEALAAAQFAGRFAVDGNVVEVAHAALAAPPASQRPRASDLLIDALATLIARGYEPGAPMVKRALSAFRSGDMSEWGSAVDLARVRHGRRRLGVRRLGAPLRADGGRSPDARAI